MGFYLDKIILNEALYLINTNKTIREVAYYFNISKTTLHRHLSKDLKYIDYDLYLKVKNIFLEHNKNKHISGGITTKLKYAKR